MLAPENGWLEEDCFLLKRFFFQGTFVYFAGAYVYMYISLCLDWEEHF